MRWWRATGALIACSVWLLGMSPALAGQASVAEKILGVLRANGQISEQEYQELLQEARAEQAQRQALPPVAAAAESPDTFRMYWKDGIRFDTADGRFKMKLGGRIQTDAALFHAAQDLESSVGMFANGTEFRRARLYLAGTVFETMKFKAQYDFAGQDVDFNDVYIEQTHIPVIGHLRLGHFKEPYGLEELTSSKYLTFMERSIANRAPGRNTGVMVYDHVLDGRVTWAAGVFWDAGDSGDSSTSEGHMFDVTARVTGLPWYRDEGRQLLHVGVSASRKFRNNDTFSFSEQPEVHLTDLTLIDTGDFLVDWVDLVTPELALVCGPFSVQGEYTKAFADAVGASDPDFDSYYLQASYFLTGEHRVYEKSAGAFSRVSPREDFDVHGGGPGAWELAARYSWADLEDASISGGEEKNITVGLSWYLNPNVRAMLHYVRADLDHVGDLDALAARFQIDF